jgi:hypothetical protein
MIHKIHQSLSMHDGQSENHKNHPLHLQVISGSNETYKTAAVSKLT